MFLKPHAHKTEDAMHHKRKKPGLSVEEGAKGFTTSSKIPGELVTRAPHQTRSTGAATTHTRT